MMVLAAKAKQLERGQSRLRVSRATTLHHHLVQNQSRRAPAPPSSTNHTRCTYLFHYQQETAPYVHWYISIAINCAFRSMHSSAKPHRGNMSTGEPATVVHMDDGSKSSYATAPASSRKTQGDGLPLLLRSGAAGFRRCLALIDLVLRVAAFGPTLAAAISTGTSDERLSVFTQFFQFHARFDDFPAFTFFMVANAIAAGYLVLSLPFSAVGILRPTAGVVRLFLLVCDMVVMLLLTAAGAAAAAILYVAHWGNQRANWVPICMQFHGFCQRTSGAVVASFLAVLVFLVLILMGAAGIRRH